MPDAAKGDDSKGAAAANAASSSSATSASMKRSASAAAASTPGAAPAAQATGSGSGAASGAPPKGSHNSSRRASSPGRRHAQAGSLQSHSQPSAHAGPKHAALGTSPSGSVQPQRSTSQGNATGGNSGGGGGMGSRRGSQGARSASGRSAQQRHDGAGEASSGGGQRRNTGPTHGGSQKGRSDSIAEPPSHQAGGAGASGNHSSPATFHAGRAASLPGSAAGGGVNGRMRASTAGFQRSGGGASSAYGGGMGMGNMSAAAAASLAAAMAQNGQLAQHLAAMGGYMRNAGASHTSPSSSMSNAQMHQPGGYASSQYMSAAAAAAAAATQNLSYERHTAELTNCIIAFLSPILPTEEEYRIKEATRRQLERLAGKVSPGAKLLAFGSMANGFALRNSDMDLCCLIGKAADGSTPPFSASALVEELGQLIREETDFNVMPLPKARIPIIKISRPPTAELPYEISCDIGFENRLALENTRLLLSYAMVDPPRLRTLVLFLKVWTKRRKLNSPYTGTLSSYGYTLLALFFLTHVKRPAVLPNLQRIPPARTLSQEEVLLNGHNIYFYDDVATLRQEWASQNTENVGELLIDFFRYFSKEFTYSRDVISLRTEGGLMSKDNETWTAELCIEDPFQLGYNVSRTVTKDGLYTIRGEFMRAARILTSKVDHVARALAELCEEREDGLSRAPDFPSRSRGGSVPGHSSAADARLMRDLYYRETPRRYDAPGASMFGGSFAFEEMARGLGQAQGGQRVAMARPTAAMLAPLSQNNGLSPRVGRSARATSRFEPPSRSARSAQPQGGFSARSEDGSGGKAYDAHLRASPQGLRPHEHPATPAADQAAGHDAHLAVPESSQVLNRSLSLPHSNESGASALDIPLSKQRVQLPLRSEPGSPSLGSPAPYGDFDAIAALNGMTLDVSGRAGPRSTSGCSSSGAGGRASPLPPLPPSSDVGAPGYLANRHAGWSFLQPALRAGGGAGQPSDARSFGGESASGHSYAPLEDDDEIGEVHDGSSSISEGTLDELARVSALQDIDDRHDDDEHAARASPALMPPGAASRIRSWARTSSAPRVEGFEGVMVPPSPELEQHLEGVEPELDDADDDDEQEVDVRSARGLAHLRAEEMATPTKATR